MLLSSPPFRAVVFAMALVAGIAPLHAGPRVWADPVTGLAIGGYDPVAYFTRHAASEGRRGVEFRWGGAVWRFLNVGNKGAFEHDPEVYTPRFAGYDAYSVANGLTVRGLPSIWLIHQNRVYLFHTAINRHLWLQDRQKLIARAEQKWPALAANLPSSLAD